MAGQCFHLRKMVLARCVVLAIIFACASGELFSDLQSSAWPPGPYAIPMPKDGCPESSAHGWRSGYINLTTTKPTTIAVLNESLLDDIMADEINFHELLKNNDVTLKDAYDVNIMGPFGNSVLQLNFCVKSKDHALHDQGKDEWIEGHYEIYGTDEGCREGFDGRNSTLKLPPLLHWNSDGYLPYMNMLLHNNGSVSLQFLLCTRVVRNVSTDHRHLTSPFMILKNLDSACPKIDGFGVTEEILILLQRVNNLSNSDFVQDITTSLHMCYFKPDTWTEDELIFDDDNQAYFDGCMIIAEAIPTVEDAYWEVRSFNYLELWKGLFGDVLRVFPAIIAEWHRKGTSPWIMYDMKRSTVISGLSVIFSGKTNYTPLIEKHKPKFNKYLRIHMSDSPWNFLSHGARLCRYQGAWIDFDRTSINTAFVLKCFRPMQARYVTLLIDTRFQKDEFLMFVYFLVAVHFHTCNPPPGIAKQCNSDMGMTDRSIQNFQVTASSSDVPEHPPWDAKAYLDGWCSSVRDMNPYLQIDLLAPTTVDGLTVFNWFLTEQSKDNNTFVQTYKHMGVRAFRLEYGTSLSKLWTYSEKEFRLDLSRQYSEPQLFMFLRPFLTRYVRVYPSHLKNHDTVCLRIELHGCRKSGIISLHCANDTTKNLVKMRFGTVKPLTQPSHVITMINVKSPLTKCKQACLDSEEDVCSFLEYTTKRACKLYAPSNTSNYKKIEGYNKYLHTAICPKGGHDLSSVTYNNTNVVFPVSMDATITDVGVITNSGYPFYYHANHLARWKIKFNDGEFIKLIFSNISLHVYEREYPQFCKDVIAISRSGYANLNYPYDLRYIANTKLIDYIFDEETFYIDNQLNGDTPNIVTQFTELSMTFITCLKLSPISYKGNGFRVIVKKEVIPSCFLLGIWDPTCNMPVMNIASDSFNGIHTRIKSPIRGDNSINWRITGPHSSVIVLIVTEFDVGCSTGSVFQIEEEVDGEFKTQSYCNSNKPVTDIFSTYAELIVGFTQVLPSFNIQREGFRAYYRIESIKETFPNTAKLQAVIRIADPSLKAPKYIARACREDFQKCYYVYRVSSNWKAAYKNCTIDFKYRFVNVHSQQEMQFINSLLRNFTRYELERDGMSTTFSTWKRDPRFYAYIGLLVQTDRNGRKNPVWSDGTHLSFSAWDVGQPSLDKTSICTRTSFDQLNKNNTWETIDCHGLKAHYFVCERDMSLPNNMIKSKENLLKHRHAPRGEQIMDTRALHKCGSGEWIMQLAVCNGIPECIDTSDEKHCPDINLGSSCVDNFFRCGNGRCIHISDVCNFIQDCEDGSDEYCHYPLCSDDEFTCDNGQCVSSHLRCDAVVNCKDKSDEANCEACNAETAFSCGGLVCIPSSLVCDKYADCSDGNDEQSCDQNFFESCESLWDNGFRRNGMYNIGGLEVQCIFDKIHSHDLVINRIHSKYLDWKKLLGSPKNFKGRIRYNDKDLLEQFIAKQQNGCILEIVQMCERFAVEVAIFDAIDFNSSSKACNCRISVEINPSEIEYLSASIPEECREGIKYHELTISKINVNVVRDSNPAMRVIDDPITCSSEHTLISNTLACEEGHHVIHADKLCLYDENSSGYIDGCRSRSHLKDCKYFQCPSSYVKCPENYCLALRFVCDGEKHCPGGEDEVDCWCQNHNRAITMMYYGSVENNHRTYIHKLARQLFLEYNSIRMMNFRVSTDMQYTNRRPITKTDAINVTIYMVSDSYETLFDSPIESSYTSDANGFMREARQTFNTTDSVVYIQDNEGSEYFMNEIIVAGVISPPGYLYRVSFDPSISRRVITNRTSRFVDIKILNWNDIGTIGSSLFPKLCKGTKTATCKNEYRCTASRICIPLHHICDGQNHCIHGDDELFCDFKCPGKCRCVGYSIDCRLRSLNNNDFSEISKTSRSLDLSNNKDITEDGFIKIRHDLPFLIRLNISNCAMKTITRETLSKMKALLVLDISYNKFTEFAEQTFSDLTFLKELNLRGNHNLRTIEPRAFVGVSQLRLLSITGTNINRILANTFVGLRLTRLDISNNMIQQIDNFAFNDLETEEVNFVSNDVRIFGTDIFTGIRSLKLLRTPAFKFCCARPGYLNEDNCRPLKDEFSSCADLMRNTALQTFMWLIGLLAILGNILSLVYRLIYNKDGMKMGFGIFVTNLAIADLLMGIYMMIIALADLIFRKRYILVEDYWIHSVWCNLAGVLSSMSSEASVLFLCFITVDRILAVKYPFGQIRIHKKNAILFSATSWLIVLSIAVLPLLYERYFKSEFYSRSGVCLALPLTRDRPPGWQYSLIIFIGFNMLAFILIAFGQGLIYREVVKSKSALLTRTQVSRRNDLKVARNLLLVVTTDFLCWFPIGCMGLMALGGHVISGDVYAWTAVLILPINSALNPFLYTLSALISSDKFTPRMEIQSPKDMSQADIGKHMRRLWNDKRLLRDSDNLNATLCSVREVCNMNRKLDATRLLVMAYHLMRSLHSLHKYKLPHRHVNEDTVFVNVVGDVRISGTLKTGMKLSVCSDGEDISKDIYDAGCIIRKLISYKTPRTSNVM